MLTIADEGGRGGRVKEKSNEMGLRVPKICVKDKS